MSHADPGPLSTYNSLQDKNLVGYFNNNRMRRHLRKSGLINKRGEIVTESTYRLTMARKEHQRHVRDLMAQAIVHKALDMERHRQASIKKKLEEIAKVELVRRVRSERARKGDEDITPFLSPRAPSGRPHSASSHRRRTRGNIHRRPSTAPTNKTSSYDKQHAVYVDEDGFPVHRERSFHDDSEEIDSHNLRELDPKVMNNISLHLRPEDREGLAPYKVNQALKPHPPPSQAKSQRIRQRPAKSKTVVTKDGRKLKPKSHKGSLALHRREPAYPHANQLQTMCDVTVRYRGNNLKIQYEREDLRDEITIYQQHCGGENLLVFEGMAEPGTDLVFTSRRHRGYPFSVTFFVNRVQSLRLSACCEYKYTPHSLLGGAKGHFKFIRVDGAAPCYRCMVEAELARRERQRYRGTQTEQRDPSPEPEPEKTVIATQTEETGEEEENKDGYEDDFEEEEKAEAETKEDSDSSEGEVEKKTKDQDTEVSDHFFSESEKADKKEKDECSDSDFEKDSDKEEEKSDKEEEKDKLDERKDDRNEDSIAEETADEETKPVEQTETEDEIASIKSEVVGKEEDGKSRREDERESERDKDEEESIRSDIERENDMQEVEAESVKSDDESEREKKEEVSNLKEEDKKEDEKEKDRTETTQKEDDEKIDSESESEMKYKNESSDEEEVTSVRSKSRASLSNSENDYRPLSPTSSSSSESENEMEKKESELLSKREDKEVVHDAAQEKGRVEDDEEVTLDDKRTAEVEVKLEEDKTDDDNQSTEDLKGTVDSTAVPEELSQTFEKTGDPQVGEIDKEGTGVRDAIIVASAEDGQQSHPPVVIISGRDSQSDEMERVEDEEDGLKSSITDEPVVSERSVDEPREADVESDRRDEDAMEYSKEDGSDEKRQEDKAQSDEDAAEEKEETESHVGDSRDVGDESSKEDAGEVGNGKSGDESADMAKDENGGEYEMKISRDGDHSERSQKDDENGSKIDEDELGKSFIAEIKQEKGEIVREDVSDKEYAIDSGVGENKVMEDEEQEAGKSENAGGDDEDDKASGRDEKEETEENDAQDGERLIVKGAEKEEEVASSGQKDKDIDEGSDKVEDSHKDEDSDKDEDSQKTESTHMDGGRERFEDRQIIEDSQNVDHNDKDDNQNDSQDNKNTEERGTNNNKEEETGSQRVVEEEKAPSDGKEDEKTSADEGKKPETGSSSDEDGSSSGSEEDVTRPAVTVLNLNEKGISPERAVKLASSLLKPRYSQVQYLLLRSNPIGDKGLVAIVQSLTEIHKRNSSNDEESGLSLTHLDIGDTQITNKGINELSEFLKLPTKLKNLNLSDNKMSKLGWLALAAGVRDNAALNTLSVEYMELGDEGAREICDAVADSKTIKELNLEGNQIGDQGGEAILKMLQDNERIEVVNFERDNNIPSHIGQEIKDML